MRERARPADGGGEAADEGPQGRFSARSAARREHRWRETGREREKKGRTAFGDTGIGPICGIMKNRKTAAQAVSAARWTGPCGAARSAAPSRADAAHRAADGREKADTAAAPSRWKTFCAVLARKAGDIMHQHEKLYHIGLCKADLEGADYAILPGDPGRVEKIAALMENAKEIGRNREYTSWLAETKGVKVLVMSTGMGGPSTAIGVEELHMLGVSHLIRVGTCGGMQLQVQAGDLVVVNGAIRQEGTSKEYLPVEFPAIADIDVTVALRQAARELGLPNHTGVVQCKDSFYGQHDPARMPVSYELENKWQAWIKGGALGSEMETAALYTVSQVLGVHAGAVMLCVWNQEREKAGLDQKETHDTTGAIRAAIRAVEILAGV